MSRRLDPENFAAEKLAWHQRIARDPKISRQAKAAAGLILHDLNPCEGGAWRSQESMAASLGVSPRQLRRLLEELQTADYLEIEVRRGRGRTNICRATVPDEAAEAPENRSSATDQTREKRPQATAQTSEKRTSATRKPVTGDRQSLYEPIKRFRAAESRRPDGGAGTPARLIPFAQTDIRQAVVQIAGGRRGGKLLGSRQMGARRTAHRLHHPDSLHSTEGARGRAAGGERGIHRTAVQ